MSADPITALRVANEVRARHKELKADLRAGRILLADVLLADPPELPSIKVRDLLLAVPKLGTKKAARALASCWISHTAQLGKISPKTRRRLLEELSVRCPSIDSGWTPETSEELAA